MITVLVYVRSSEFNIPWRLDDKMNILDTKNMSHIKAFTHQWMVTGTALISGIHTCYIVA